MSFHSIKLLISIKILCSKQIVVFLSLFISYVKREDYSYITLGLIWFQCTLNYFPLGVLKLALKNRILWYRTCCRLSLVESWIG